MYFGPSLIIQINFNLESQSIHIVWWFIIIIVDSDSLDGYIFNITDILCELHLLYELIYLLMIEKIWEIQYFWKKKCINELLSIDTNWNKQGEWRSNNFIWTFWMSSLRFTLLVFSTSSSFFFSFNCIFYYMVTLTFITIWLCSNSLMLYCL